MRSAHQTNEKQTNGFKRKENIFPVANYYEGVRDLVYVEHFVKLGWALKTLLRKFSFSDYSTIY